MLWPISLDEFIEFGLAFWAKASLIPTGCWEWPEASPTGYGYFWFPGVS